MPKPNGHAYQIDGRDLVLGHDCCRLVVQVDHAAVASGIAHGGGGKGKEQLSLRLLGNQHLRDDPQLRRVDIREAGLPWYSGISQGALPQGPDRREYMRMLEIEKRAGEWIDKHVPPRRHGRPGAGWHDGHSVAVMW